jgi:predicted nuclease of restriction endonuclease-like (RecB) superfamily
MMEQERPGSAFSRQHRASDRPRPAAGSGPADQAAQTASVQQPVALKPIAGLPANYGQVLQDIKARVRESQATAATVVNRELIALYLQIGRLLSTQAGAAEWGDKVVERLATDLRLAFPSMSGFSRRNLFYMRQVYEAWADAEESVRQAVGQIPWGHHLVLLTKVRQREARVFYLRHAVAHGWSRSVLTLQIEAGLHERKGKALTNFRRTLPPPQSDLAQQTLKDPYLFDFLTIADDAREREVEQALIDHVQKFLLELGVGFAFVGRQVHLDVGGEDFYVDLLFYHLKLRCYVVVDLKAVAFKPEFAGKMTFYLSAVDDRMRHRDDAPSIGLLLCKSKNRVIVEYALRDLAKPIGVAHWETRLVEALPEDLKGSLPTVEELEAELA